MLKFERTEPVASNRGRKAEDNPFDEVVAEIAGKTDSKGQPQALATTIQIGKDDDRVKVANGVKARLKSAGSKCSPEVTVHSHVNFAEDGKSMKVTFWTGPKIKREVKPKVETAPEKVETAPEN